MSHQECFESLATFAINALPEPELSAAEQHIEGCAICRNELDKLRETTSLLAFDIEEPPASVWQAISNNIQTDATTHTATHPFPLGAQRSRRRYQWTAGVAAALLVIAGIGTFWATRDTAVVQQPSLAAEATQAGNQTGAHKIALKSADGALRANAVLLPDGKGYLTNVNLPALPSDRTYQLWAMNGTSPISAGVLGESPSTAAFTASGNVGALAISEEPKGGSVSPTSTPLVSGLIT